MNQNIVIGGVVVVAVLVGGVILYNMGNTNSSPQATSTPESSTNTTQTQTPGAPVVVTSPTAYPTDTTVVVSGTVTPNGAFTSYWYEFGTNGNLGSKTPNQSVGSGYSPIGAPAYITGLTKNMTYYFRLVAQNQFGTIAGSQNTFHTTVGTPPPVGSAPSAKTLAATGISRTTANVTGEVTPNKSSTQYWFEYGQSANLGNTTALQSVGDGSSAVSASFSLQNLTPATAYYFRIDAQNQFGTVQGQILTFTTPGPAVSVSAVPVITTQIAGPVATTTATLNGTVNPAGAQTTYWFEYSTDSAYDSSLLKTTPQRSVGAGANTTSIQANVSALRPNTTYYYRIVARNLAGTVRGLSLSFKTN